MNLSEPDAGQYTAFVTKWRLSLIRLPDGSGEGVMTRVDVPRGPNDPDYGECRVPRPRYVASEPVDPETSLERACRRAKKQVRLACKVYEVDHLATFTWRGAMEDLEVAKAVWAKFCRSVEQRLGAPWVRVAVPERHKSGGIHIHCAVKGHQNIKVLRWCWYRALGGVGDERGELTPGQVDVRGPGSHSRKRGYEGKWEWDRDRLASYLSKYITDDMTATAKGAKRYWATKGYTPQLVKTVMWLDCTSEVEAIRQSYAIVAGGNVEGVQHWCTCDGAVYQVMSRDPPSCPF